MRYKNDKKIKFVITTFVFFKLKMHKNPFSAIPLPARCLRRLELGAYGASVLRPLDIKSWLRQWFSPTHLGLLNLVQLEIAPFDPPTPKITPYRTKHEMDPMTPCGDMVI